MGTETLILLYWKFKNIMLKKKTRYNGDWNLHQPERTPAWIQLKKKTRYNGDWNRCWLLLKSGSLTSWKRRPDIMGTETTQNAAAGQAVLQLKKKTRYNGDWNAANQIGMASKIVKLKKKTRYNGDWNECCSLIFCHINPSVEKEDPI